MATLPYTLTNGTTADADHVMGNLNAINNDYPNQVGYAAAMGLQEGVYASGDLMVTQRAAGVNMSVDVAAGHVAVQDDASTQGLLAIVYKSAVTNVAISAADATNPRVDQIVVSKAGVVSAVTGTATVGATLDNRTGAAALPASSVRLADILVAAAAASVSNTNIRDRRPWARGGYARVTKSSGTTSTTSTTFVALDATNLRPRIECSGVPVRVTLRSTLSATVAAYAALELGVDGAAVAGTDRRSFVDSATADRFLIMSWDYTPAAGSHRFDVWWKTSAGTISAYSDATYLLELIVEEQVRQQVANNTVTSG